MVKPLILLRFDLLTICKQLISTTQNANVRKQKEKPRYFTGLVLGFLNRGTRIALRRFSTGGGRLGASDNKYRANRVQIANPLKSGRVRYFSLLSETGNVLTIFFRSNRRARSLNLKKNFT